MINVSLKYNAFFKVNLRTNLKRRLINSLLVPKKNIFSEDDYLFRYQTPTSNSNSLSKTRVKPSQNPPIAICFQIMTRAEPVEMVKATIDSLIAIKARQDEIVIVDNNHTDKALYQPLQQYCESLNKSLNVHFYHEDYIAGYKAGALNLALSMMDKNCNYIVVVDSDYQALPYARQRIVNAIKRYPSEALLQFPQYYRDNDKPDIHSELNHYFSYHLRRGFNQDCALSTGTFAVINKQALLCMGGWSGESITEDAQMGVHMHRVGATTQFIPEVIATGLLPQNLSDLIGQRRRWIYGNMQVLSSYFKSNTKSHTKEVIQSSNALNQPQSTKQKLRLVRAHLSQLSAWVNFTGVFILIQAISVILLAVSLSRANTSLTQVALQGLTLSYIAYAVYLTRRLVAYLKDSKPLSLPDAQTSQIITAKTKISSRIKAFLVHINFWELGALSWLPVLWGRDKPFVCTPKISDSNSTLTEILASVIAVPKLLIVLNVVTAGLVFNLSMPLFVVALALVALKVVASSLVTYNFVASNSVTHGCVAKSFSVSHLQQAINTSRTKAQHSRQDASLNSVFVSESPLNSLRKQSPSSFNSPVSETLCVRNKKMPNSMSTRAPNVSTTGKMVESA